MTEWVLILMLHSAWGGVAVEQVAGFRDELQCKFARLAIKNVQPSATTVCVERASPSPGS